MSKLLILHDSAEFGGHERMLLSLLPSIADGHETVFYLPRANRRLRAAVESLLPSIRVVDWPFVKRRGEPYLHRLRLGYRAAVRRIFAVEQPDQVLLVQGRIEHLAVPMAALPRSSRLVSFLPMAHRMRDMGRGGGDGVRRALYARPDHFIVPSEAVAAQVRGAGGTGAITVAHNVVAPPPRVERQAARETLGLPSDRRIALFLGRLEARQKGLDTLLDAIQRSGDALKRDEIVRTQSNLTLSSRRRPGPITGKVAGEEQPQHDRPSPRTRPLMGPGLRRDDKVGDCGSTQSYPASMGWTFVFVGEGDASAQLQAAADARLADIRLVPWTDRPDLYLSAADILLLPSRWEGVPLVMLEAMHCGLPILASEIDVFRLYLPPENIADFAKVDLAAKLDALTAPEAVAAFVAHSTACLAPLTLPAAQASFAAALQLEAA